MGPATIREPYSKISYLRSSFIYKRNALSTFQYMKYFLNCRWNVLPKYDTVIEKKRVSANKACYTLNVCAPPQIHMLKSLTLDVMVLGGGATEQWLDYEGRDLMNEVSALLKETTESSLALSVMWECEKMALFEPRSGLSPDTESLGALILGLPVSGIRRNKFLLLCYPMAFCYSSLKRPRQSIRKKIILNTIIRI